MAWNVSNLLDIREGLNCDLMGSDIDSSAVDATWMPDSAGRDSLRQDVLQPANTQPNTQLAAGKEELHKKRGRQNSKCVEVELESVEAQAGSLTEENALLRVSSCSCSWGMEQIYPHRSMHPLPLPGASPGAREGEGDFVAARSLCSRALPAEEVRFFNAHADGRSRD